MKELFHMLKPYVKRHKKYFFFMNITTFLAATSQTLIPIAASNILDGLLGGEDKKFLYMNIGLILGYVVFDLLMQMVQRYSSVVFSQSVIYDIRQDLFETLQKQELEFYSKETVGQIMSRSIQEVISLREILTWAYRISTLAIFLFIGSIITMSRISTAFTTVFIIIPLVLLIISISSATKNRQIWYNRRYVNGVLNEALAENLSGIQTVKAFGREDEQVQFFNVRNQEFYDVSMKTQRVRATLIPGMIFLISLSLIFLVLIGGNLVASGEITPGNFIAFLLLALNLAIPGRFLGFVGIVAQDANAAAIRLNEIFKAPTSVQNHENANDICDIKGDIVFDNVSFKFGEGNFSLQNINLHIPAGQKIALLGATGSGKSTLIDLIPRFYDPTEGRILIDKRDIKGEFTTNSLRSNISIVHQESFLFTQSLRDNITFGKIDATDEEIIQAAKDAQIHEFIISLEDGYDTIVGERGVTLSGGQRQRVTIARTLLSDPKILIFDDSVSAVDPETEAKIQSSLETAATERTTIIISQRPSSLRYVDRIVVLEEGEIKQDGTHEELKNVEGIYKDFIDSVENQVKFLEWDADKIGGIN